MGWRVYVWLCMMAFPTNWPFVRVLGNGQFLLWKCIGWRMDFELSWTFLPDQQASFDFCSRFCRKCKHALKFQTVLKHILIVRICFWNKRVLYELRFSTLLLFLGCWNTESDISTRIFCWVRSQFLQIHCFISNSNIIVIDFFVLSCACLNCWSRSILWATTRSEDLCPTNNLLFQYFSAFANHLFHADKLHPNFFSILRRECSLFILLVC